MVPIMAKSKKPTRTRKSARRADDYRVKKPRLPKGEYMDWRTFDPSTARGTNAAELAEQLVTYRDHLDELLRHKGNYVLIRGREIVGIYADEQEALLEAAVRFGTEPVLVKQIVAREPIHYMNGIVY
jgi:hypothetical protein